MTRENQSPVEKLGIAVETIAADYDRGQPPFEDTDSLTEEFTAELDSDREKTLFHTLTSSLNFQRDADVLYRDFIELWHRKHWIFEPESVIEERDFTDLEELFDEVGTRFGTRDAKIWYEISRTLYLDHNSNPMHLFAEHDYEMERISEYVQQASGDTRFFSKKFPYLSGDKIRPLWLRNISWEVRPLTGAEGLDIPVDVQIIKVTNAICGTDLEPNEEDKKIIRAFWRQVCEPVNVTPTDIDSALWWIGSEWNTWGQEYLEDELNRVGLTFDEVNIGQIE